MYQDKKEQVQNPLKSTSKAQKATPKYEVAFFITYFIILYTNVYKCVIMYTTTKKGR